MRIASLHRYPVKGLSPERIASATLVTGSYFPGDRLFAIENGPSGFDPAEPRHQSKIRFLMLMRDEPLAHLRTSFDDETSTLTIALDGREAVRGDLSTPEGRLAVEAFMRRYLPKALRGPPKVLAAPPGFRFTDSSRGYVSIINLASIGAIEDLIGRPVDPLRFRGNLMVDGLPPWAEFDLVGRILHGPDGIVLKVLKRIVRCAATNVDPRTGERDMNIPAVLMHRLGHADCGIYAEIRAGGTLREGDVLAPAPDLFEREALTAPAPGR